MHTINRRRFLLSTAAAGFGLAAAGTGRARAASPNGKLRVLSIGVTGTIGGMDRKQVAAHPGAEIAGLCDVDSNALAQAANEHPGAFTCRDYREAFAKHGDKFDAVIVAVPDHSHAPILLTAMAHGKHVYGQKPLVQQLAEVAMVEKAIAAKPGLVTQLGNQRMASASRRAAVEILRQGMLGKAVKAYAWVGAPSPDQYFNYQKEVRINPNIPANLDWNLWLGPCAEMPYHDLIAPMKWRSWWDFGTNGLGDWGCHLLDVFFFAYDGLKSPVSVRTDCPRATDTMFHVNPCQSTLKYKVRGERFANSEFLIHYRDSGQVPTAGELGIPTQPGDKTMSAVVCEGGTLLLQPEGQIQIWRDGKLTNGLKMPGLPEFPPLNHWHAWVDNCLGKKSELRTPFKDAARITEATLLTVKATRFPGQELLWNKADLAFTNNPEATRTLVRRAYRQGFAPPVLG